VKDLLKISVLAAGATFMGAMPAQAPKAEVGLLGIRLYDTGVTVVKKFGSPTDVQAVTFSQNNAMGGGGGGSRGPSGVGAPPAGGGGRGAAGGAEFVVPPLGIDQVRRPQVAGGPGGESGGAPRPAGGAGSSGGGAGTQGADNVQYVRWIYRRGAGSSVNFVLNKFNKVVQIEAIGVVDGRVRTAKGITLGSSLAQVIKLYSDPESYDVGSDYFMVKFLSKYKVAFRLTRETEKTPYRITSIIVSAGRA